mmetsp:Transcript_30174/g.86930  ORF Transcript_30174/g.86930 Transcript_30174/m.86930 type:complete len:303 (-) Transcript_30174:147-1055(-)
MYSSTKLSFRHVNFAVSPANTQGSLHVAPSLRCMRPFSTTGLSVQRGGKSASLNFASGPASSTAFIRGRSARSTVMTCAGAKSFFLLSTRKLFATLLASPASCGPSTVSPDSTAQRSVCMSSMLRGRTKVHFKASPNCAQDLPALNGPKRNAGSNSNCFAPLVPNCQPFTGFPKNLPGPLGSQAAVNDGKAADSSKSIGFQRWLPPVVWRLCATTAGRLGCITYKRASQFRSLRSSSRLMLGTESVAKPSVPSSCWDHPSGNIALATATWTNSDSRVHHSVLQTGTMRTIALSSVPAATPNC